MPEKPAYIGPERRKNQRRSEANTLRSEQLPNRRVTPDRRQDAVAGVIANMSGEDMLLLAELWRKVEEEASVPGEPLTRMSYEDIIAREA